MTSDKNLQELFHDTLKDIYFAEKKILGALPKMAKAAQSQDLKATPSPQVLAPVALAQHAELAQKLM